MYIKNRLLNFISAHKAPTILKCRVYRSFTSVFVLGTFVLY